MPAVKYPCLQCKEKHVKCDEEKPKCKRCVQKNLPCSRPTKKTIFRKGASIHFDKNQKWVNSQARQFRVQTTGESSPPGDNSSPEEGDPSGWPGLGHHNSQSSSASPTKTASPQTPHATERHAPEKLAFFQCAAPTGFASLTAEPSSGPRRVPPISHLEPSRAVFPPSSGLSSVTGPSSHSSEALPGISSARRTDSSGDSSEIRQFPLQDVQEACLLRYFVEEISRWFDLCDEDRHFQLVVPIYARRHPHLLNAIFAVAARHLSRLPQYKTREGILYQGQLLPNLSQHDAVEYMLKCIPAFRRFNELVDDDFRDSIIATAVILRQLEEIDDEDVGSDEEDDPMAGSDPYAHEKQINFLPIINAVLRDPSSQALLGQRSLIQAAYWFALRQEIYHSFTRRKAPQLILPPEYWHSATTVNKTVMHTVQVAKWHWGGGTNQEWLRLMDQQAHLEQNVLCNTQPLFCKPADKSKGEIFPTLWYATHIELTSIQQALMARSVLVSEDPFLKSQPASRSSFRKVENEVRILMLDLCGIALCHPSSAPALVNAAIGIQLYGDFFTDHYERKALKGVVERYRDAHAWPVKRLLEMFT